jgi:hypothetical protein
MGRQEEVELARLQVSLLESPVLREIDEQASRDDPHGRDRRMVFVDRVLELALAQRVVEVGTLSQPEGLVDRREGAKICEARHSADQHKDQDQRDVLPGFHRVGNPRPGFRPIGVDSTIGTDSIQLPLASGAHARRG